MNGILLVDKELEWTSFDCVAKIRSLIRSIESMKIKVGHAGTLDPMATGLMIILVGSYTKKADTLTKKNKTYQVTMRLGQVSTTGDSEGEITDQSSDQPSTQDIKDAFVHYIGNIEQVPPAYSAIKINGVRAYKLAREGKSIEMKSRPVTIYSIDLMDYEYPNVTFSTNVSSGTYIRSLVGDIGDTLKTGAYTTDLRRTSIDKYNVVDAVKINELSKDNLNKLLITEL